MNWPELLSVVAMALILEGLLPFLAPSRWREVVIEIIKLPDSNIRIYSGIIMFIGAITLILVRNLG